MDKFSNNRPSTSAGVTSTPTTSMVIGLLGPGATSGSVVLSKTEVENLNKLYGFKPEKPNKKPPPPKEPKRTAFESDALYQAAMKNHEAALKAHAKWQDPQPLLQAGAIRNMLRFAEADGLRIMAVLAKFCSPDEDPVKVFLSMVLESGHPLDPGDVAWVEDENEDDV